MWINKFNENEEWEDEEEFKPLFGEDKIKDDFLFKRKSDLPFDMEEEEEEEFVDDDDDDDDDDYIDDVDDVKDKVPGEESSDDYEQLADLIQDMISRSGIANSYVNVENGDISVQFLLDKKERFSNMMKVLGMLNRISTDILIQFDTHVELWETETNEPLLTVDFYYNPKKENKNWRSGSSSNTWSSSNRSPGSSYGSITAWDRYNFDD